MLPTASRARLIEIITRRSYGTGVEIKLASGRTSNFYFNMKPTMLDPEGAYLIGALLSDAITPGEADMIGGLEVGAIPLAAAVAAVSHAKGQPMPAFFIRKQAKGHGTQSLVEGLPRGETLKGRRVIILEDVTTTGGSALKAIEAVRADGAEVVRVITIVDREEGAAEAFAAAGITFSALLQLRDFPPPRDK
ncbi:MAG TPA: orotate phosphoribosyltransferase [Hyphomicrobiaceae bacterium]|nr:orotate phosphoribosyltransferase [Hyphomicrobiaceae bacterium]